jgi:drug/metabolite transporter (DMT)-like permease
MGDLYALASALCFAISNVTVMRGAPRGAGDNGAFLSLLLTAAISAAGWLVIGSRDGFAPVTVNALLWLAGAGVFTAFIGRVFLYASIQHLGAMRASAIKRLNPFFAVLLGVTVLGEVVSRQAGWGILLVVVSFVLIHARLGDDAEPASGPGGWRRLLNRGYVYGPVSAFGYAFGYLLRKAGLDQTPDPFFGAMVGTLVGAMLFAAAGLFSKPYRDSVWATFHRPNAWLYAAGIMSSFGQILYFAALNVSPMSRVALIVSMELFITMALSAIFFSDRLTFRFCIAALFGAVGTALLASR